MKKWRVTLTAENEESALIYLESLIHDFKAAVKLKEDVNKVIIKDPDKGEKMTCRRAIFERW